MPVAPRPPSVEFKPPSKKVIVIAIVIAALFVLLSSLTSIATFYTDSLLFSSLGQGSTFSSLVKARVFIPLTIFVVTTLLVAITIFLASRGQDKKKSDVNELPDSWAVPFLRIFRARPALMRNLVSLAVGAVFAASTVGYYKEWILFRNGQTVGTKDPLFKKDIGFYLFDLPFIKLALSWLFTLSVILIVTAFVIHYIHGSLRLERGHRHISVPAKVHLSITCAVAGLTKAAQYYFDRFDLVHSTRGAVDGASYTDVHAQLPGFRLLIFVAIIASVLFIVNVYRKGIVLPLVAIALWVIVSLIVGSVYPLIIQNFVVKPSRNTKEKPYSARNIAATRTAYGLDDVETEDIDFQQGITAEDAPRVKEVLAQSLLWDETALEPWMQQQRGEQIYEFKQFDRDRYTIDGTVTPVFSSVRELIAPDSLPDTSWQSKHVTYSHGFGAAIARAASVVSSNEPSYLVSELPNKEKEQVASGFDLDTSRARVYFGEGLEDYVFVGSNKTEQTPTDDKVSTSSLGGVKVNNFFKKAAFALRFSDYNVMISDAVTSDSKIVYVRDPRERVQKIAPFLDVDSNPYPVVIDDEVVWIVDAYTTSAEYPYAQYVDSDNLAPGSALNKKLNYVRNSVKATVNARTGKVTLYVVDDKDPIIKAYVKAFPSLFTDGDKAPQEIKDHFRYPEDLFNVQSAIYGDYHITDPTVLLKGSSRWQAAPEYVDSETPAVASASTVATTVQGGRADKAKTTGTALAPLYQYVEHASMSSPEFVLTRAFVPIRSTFKMDSFLSASSDGKNYGKLRLVSFDASAESSALSPTQMMSQINSDKEFSQEVTLLGQRGSQVVRGPLQIVPVNDTVVYVQPVYVQGNSKDALPVLTYVTVSVSGKTVCAPTIDQAIDALVNNTSMCVPFTQQLVPNAGKDEPETPSETPHENDPSDISSLSQEELISRLADASAAYEKAKDPLDLGALQKAADEMVALVDELNKRNS